MLWSLVPSAGLEILVQPLGRDQPRGSMPVLNQVNTFHVSPHIWTSVVEHDYLPFALALSRRICENFEHLPHSDNVLISIAPRRGDARPWRFRCRVDSAV